MWTVSSLDTEFIRYIAKRASLKWKQSRIEYFKSERNLLVSINVNLFYNKTLHERTLRKLYAESFCQKCGQELHVLKFTPGSRLFLNAVFRNWGFCSFGNATFEDNNLFCGWKLCYVFNCRAYCGVKTMPFVFDDGEIIQFMRLSNANGLQACRKISMKHLRSN